MSDGEVSPVTSILQSVLPGSDSALCGLDADGCLTWANETFEILVGRRREDLLGRPLSRLLDHSEQRGLAEVFARVLVDGERIHGYQARLRARDGRTEAIQISGMPVADTGDGTAVVMALERIADDPSKPPAEVVPHGADGYAVESMPERLLMQTDAAGNCIHVSEDWYFLTGSDPSILLGQPLMQAIHPEFRTPELVSLLSGFDGQPCTWQGRVDCQGHNNARLPANLQVIQLVDVRGRFSGISALFSPVPAASASAREVRDPIGQYRLDARQPGQMVYDYDVATGSVRWSGAIRQLTGVRPERFRNTDLSAWEQRIHPDDRPQLMEHLRQAVESGNRYTTTYRLRREDGAFLTVEEHASVLRDARGIAYRMLGRIRLLRAAEETPGRVEERAERRPYLSRSPVEEELGWVERISQALKEDRLRLYSQRTFLLRDGSPAHSEILLRMLDEQGGMLSAATFLPPAMRCNLMPLLDRWVIRRVCTALAANPGELLPVSVNLAPGSLMDGSFLDFVERQLGEHGLDASRLAFEIAESAVTASSAVIAFMRRMRELGSIVILDNVGGGLCSLGYLRGLPVDAFKIDGGFIRHLVEDPVDRAIVEAIVKVGRTMGVELMAQGVEDRGAMDLLGEMGVEKAQGMALHAPEPWRPSLATEPG